MFTKEDLDAIIFAVKTLQTCPIKCDECKSNLENLMFFLETLKAK